MPQVTVACGGAKRVLPLRLAATDAILGWWILLTVARPIHSAQSVCGSLQFLDERITLLQLALEVSHFSSQLPRQVVGGMASVRGLYLRTQRVGSFHVFDFQKEVLTLHVGHRQALLQVL